MLSAWRSADKLFCPRCTFTGGKYNFTVALDRYVPQTKFMSQTPGNNADLMNIHITITLLSQRSQLHCKSNNIYQCECE